MEQKGPKGGIGNEIRMKVPKVFLEEFQKNPRILIKHHPAGIFPIDPGILKKVELLQKLVLDKEFQENFELVAVSKSML